MDSPGEGISLCAKLECHVPALLLILSHATKSSSVTLSSRFRSGMQKRKEGVHVERETERKDLANNCLHPDMLFRHLSRYTR